MNDSFLFLALLSLFSNSRNLSQGQVTLEQWFATKATESGWGNTPKLWEFVRLATFSKEINSTTFVKTKHVNKYSLTQFFQLRKCEINMAIYCTIVCQN